MMGLGLIIPTSPSFFHGFVNYDVLSPALCGFLKEPYNSEHVLLPSGYVKIAIENGHRNLIYPLEMMIFHVFFVCLPEGTLETRPPAYEDTELPLHQQTLHLLAMSWNPSFSSHSSHLVHEI